MFDTVPLNATLSPLAVLLPPSIEKSSIFEKSKLKVSFPAKPLTVSLLPSIDSAT